MAVIPDGRKEIEAKFMTEYWNLRKAYYEPEDRQDYWNELVDTVDALGEKYKGDFYLEQMLILMVSDIDARATNANKMDHTLKVFNYWRRKRGLPVVEVVKKK